MASELPPLDLDMLANDIADAMDLYDHSINASAVDIRRALVPFLEVVAPGRLTDEQRMGLDLLR
jgi:hypothetical protein